MSTNPNGAHDGAGNGAADAGAPFVSQLRSRPGVLRLAEPGQPTISVRVQLMEAWDLVRVEVSPSEPVLTVKVRALEALRPQADFHDDFVVKLNGFEVLDENVSVAESGALDGSTYLVTHRRRRVIHN